VTSPAWPRHLRTLRAELRARRDALLTRCAGHLPDCAPPPVRAAASRLAHAADGVDDGARRNGRGGAGVVVLSGPPVVRRRARRPAPAPHVRRRPPDRLDEGVQRLARALRDV